MFPCGYNNNNNNNNKGLEQIVVKDTKHASFVQKDINELKEKIKTEKSSMQSIDRVNQHFAGADNDIGSKNKSNSEASYQGYILRQKNKEDELDCIQKKIANTKKDIEDKINECLKVNLL